MSDAIKIVNAYVDGDALYLFSEEPVVPDTGKRRFALYDQYGDKTELNGEIGIYWDSPEGLGMKFNAKCNDLHNGFFKETAKSIIPQGSITGQFVLVGHRANGAAIDGGVYAQYRQLADKIMAAQELYFAYKPYGDTEYRCRVAIESLGKTEKKNGWLYCPCVLKPMTPWYNTNVIEYESEDMPGDVRIPINKAVGHIDAALVVEISGGFGEEYSVSLIGSESGKEYGAVVIEGDLDTDETLVISTKYDDSYVRIRQNGVERDVIDQVEIARNPYFRLPRTEDCILRILSPYGGLFTTSISVYEYYRSV